MTYDFVIIGGGPAGIAAGVYAARKKIRAVLITDKFGGQSIVSNDIQNWIGEKSISGFDLAQKMEEHLSAWEGIEIIEGDLVAKVEKIFLTGQAGSQPAGFKISTKNGKTLESRTVLVCSGSGRKKLGVKGEKEFDGKGVVYCATCDAPLFSNKTVAVIGAGDAGLEAVRDLIFYAEKIYLLVRSERIRGDAVTFEEISKSSKVEIIYNAEVQEILGDKFVTNLKYLDKKPNALKELKLDGIFVEIGSAANTEFVKDLVKLDQRGQIMVDCRTQCASEKGIWAAGDATDCLYKQNNIAAGDAIKAVLNIYDYLKNNHR